MTDPSDASTMRDEEIRAATVGEVQRHDGPIRLVASDPAWPALFRREEERIAAALGDGALRLEHVGSTAVPGLAAKPVIDVVLVVPDSSDESSYVPQLESVGYVLRIREPSWHQHRLLRGPDTDVNLHVFSEGCPEIDRMIRFRDHLRSRAADKELYERAKRDLAKLEWTYVQHYADAKRAVIEEIMGRASAE